MLQATVLTQSVLKVPICIRTVLLISILILVRSKKTELIADRRKEAIQKTIMAMTLGKDVSALFPDVLKNIATADLDQKKLVYLYLM